MKIAAFYENIKTGAGAAGISMENALGELKEAGMDLLYANYEEIRKDLTWLRPVMEQYEIGVEGLYGFFDFPHQFPDERYKECIALCAELGGTNVLLLPGIILPDEKADEEVLTQRMIDGLALAAEYGQPRNVAVTLEDFDGMVAPYNCISGMKMFMDSIPKLGCSFDTGNFIMFGEDPLEAFHLLKDRTCTVHIKDRSRTPVNPGDIPKQCADGSTVYPCPVGRGYIPIPEIVKELKEDGYTGNLIAEMYDCDEETMLSEIRNSVLFLKELL